MKNNRCLCCGSILLRQASKHHLYWYCPHCRQEMLAMSEIREPRSLDPSELFERFKTPLPQQVG